MNREFVPNQIYSVLLVYCLYMGLKSSRFKVQLLARARPSLVRVIPGWKQVTGDEFCPEHLI